MREIEALFTSHNRYHSKAFWQIKDTSSVMMKLSSIHGSYAHLHTHNTEGQDEYSVLTFSVTHKCQFVWNISRKLDRHDTEYIWHTWYTARMLSSTLITLTTNKEILTPFCFLFFYFTRYIRLLQILTHGVGLEQNVIHENWVNKQLIQQCLQIQQPLKLMLENFPSNIIVSVHTLNT